MSTNATTTRKKSDVKKAIEILNQKREIKKKTQPDADISELEENLLLLAELYVNMPDDTSEPESKHSYEESSSFYTMVSSDNNDSS